MNNTHPLDVAAAVAVASLQALGQLARLVLAHSIALVLTLAGWRPKSSTDVSTRTGTDGVLSFGTLGKSQQAHGNAHPSGWPPTTQPAGHPGHSCPGVRLRKQALMRVEPGAGHTVLELRRLARQALGSSATVGGRRIAQARKADLLLVLQLSTT